MKTNDLSRRAFVTRLASTCLGVTVAPAFAAPAAKAKAQRVIYLYLQGAMSHLDTFDLKPDNKEVQGPTTAIKTSADGVIITDKLPQLAKHMHHMALIRSMNHKTAVHEIGQYLVHTGFKKQNGIVHPTLGAWNARLGTHTNPSLPPYIYLGGFAQHPGCGFLDARYGPVPLGSAEQGLPNSHLPASRTQKELTSGLDLTASLDAEFSSAYNLRDIKAYTDLYTDAVRLMSSKDLDAFDISKEPAAAHENYGNTKVGKGLLLARRLIERGASYVEIEHGNWDTHLKNHEGVARLCGELDPALASLLNDLQQRGLLDSTLVVLASEFGRTPVLDETGGRDHHSLAFTCALAGAGIKGGQAYGKSDERAHEVAEDPVSPLDFNATIAHCLGLPQDKFLAPFPGGQEFGPFGKKTGEKGKVISAIL